MWKIFCPLLLMLFTFDYPRGRSARAEPIRANGELDPRDDDQNHREEIRKRAEIKNDDPKFPFYGDDENSSERIGRWRKNGEALEPKWRDGDTVPLLPFSQLTRYTAGDLDNIEEDEEVSNPRGPKFKQNGETQFSRNTERIPYADHRDYGSIDQKRENRNEEILSRKRNNRPANAFKPEATSNDEEETKTEDLAERRRESTSTKYREAFQVRPNDYEHELDDEEYLKPRPRKRRPPQNYEFALTWNETSRPEASGFKPNVQTTSSESESRNQFAKNAMELKSLLKMQQEEGLSLSELLQRRNLTLNDLLKGRADAINALRSKDADTDDYVDERTTIPPLAKSTTKRPSRTSTEATRSKSSLREGIISIVPVVVDLHENASGPSEMRLGQSTTGKSFDTELPRARGTPSAGILTLVTTSMPFPVATNSMELLRSEESTASLRGNGEIRFDGLDEDEIMEFSDFPDYKNGRNAMSPVWLTVKDENGESPELPRENYEDKGSTLSIEQLLNPTERSKSTSENEKRMNTEDSVTIGRPGKEDYNMYMDHEYQDDASAAYQDRNVEVTTSTDESDHGKTVTSGMEIMLDSPTDGNSTKHHGTNPDDANYTLRHEHGVNATTKKSYDDIISEVEPEARAEIFELFASGSAGKRLERLLKSRNMSLEELIALRQRGSSKVHLAEVSRIKVTKLKNENKEENSSDAATSSFTENGTGEGRAIGNNYDKRVNGYLTESYENVPKSASYPVNFIQPEEITTARSVSTVATSRTEDGSVLDGKEEIGERREVQIVDLLTTFDSLPFAKDIQRKLAGEYNREEKKRLPADDDNLRMIVVNNREIVGANDTANTIQSGFVKEIVKHEPNSIDIRTIYRETDVFTDDEGRSEKERTLSKIRPSIIASGAILGVTIVVFLAIFITCRIKQKQKYRYRNTFSRAVFQGPMLAARKLSNSSSLSTVMVNVIATSTTKRPEKNDTVVHAGEMDSKSDIDNDSLDANDSWETIPDYMK
ncbi:uncharacterized protein LOC143365419 [Halictus rubicundus]|uniref:uncharacterized protein LOC143365419 n=1 Tax=Halictus rubicundus TaxID=77578 RepID=UPI004035A870